MWLPDARTEGAPLFVMNGAGSLVPGPGKTVLVAVFLFAMLVPLIAGCGGGEKVEKLELVIWEQKDPEEQLILRKHIDRFMHRHPNVVISTAHFETDQLHSQFQTAALAGGGPDLVYGPSDKIGPYSVMGLIQPLDDLFDREFFGSFEAKSLPKLGGRIYAVPDQIGNHLMLLYNKAMVGHEPVDSDEWIAMCSEATKDSNGDGIPDQYGLVFNFNEPFWLVPFLGGFNGAVMNDRFEPTLGTPAMVGALRFLADLRNRYKIIPRESNYEVSDTMFKKGQAAFIINGPWSLKAYIKAGIDLGVMALPKLTQTGMYPAPMVSSKGYSINVNAGKKRLPVVRELLVFLTSEEVQRDIVQDLLILPSRSSLYRDAVVSGNEVLRGSVAQAEHGKPMPVVPEMRAIWDAIRPYYQSVLGGEMTPEEAAAGMQDRAEKKIREMKG